MELNEEIEKILERADILATKLYPEALRWNKQSCMLAIQTCMLAEFIAKQSVEKNERKN